MAKYEHYELTPLIAAVEPGRCRGEQRAIVRLLIQRGANVSSTGYAEATALVIAAEEPDEEIVRLLLNAGAEVNAADHEGTTALMNAAWMGNGAMAALLLEHGANVNARTTTRSGVGRRNCAQSRCWRRSCGGCTPAARSWRGYQCTG